MEIWEMTAVDIGKRIRQGEFTSEEAVRSFLERARRGEDRIHAFLHLDEEEALRQAREAGIQPISLGKRILRTETAGLAILSLLMMKAEGAF